MKIKRQKEATTGKLTKAQKFILATIQKLGGVYPVDLALAVCQKLGLSTDWHKYADVDMPKLPPEYENAINEAYTVLCDLQRQAEAKKNNPKGLPMEALYALEKGRRVMERRQAEAD